jgi:hypothetical protein
LPALLNRIFRHVEAGASAGLVRFGPCYTLSGGRLVVESGPLAGTVLDFKRSASDTKADFSLHELAGARSPASADPVAHCHFDREPDNGTETLWGIFIRSRFRHRGLATLLVRLAFRDLLASGRRHWFAIRKLMQVDSEGRSQPQAPGGPKPGRPQSSRITLHNLGLGLVALRLGFKPKPDLERLLAPGNVKAVQAIPPAPPSPPGLLLRIETLPGLLVAVLIDPETGRPLADAGAYERFVSPRQLLRQAVAGQAIVGNIDYRLSRSAIQPFAARLADDESELRHFTAALLRGAQD